MPLLHGWMQVLKKGRNKSNVILLCRHFLFFYFLLQKIKKFVKNCFLKMFVFLLYLKRLLVYGNDDIYLRV